MNNCNCNKNGSSVIVIQGMLVYGLTNLELTVRAPVKKEIVYIVWNYCIVRVNVNSSHQMLPEI